MPSLSGFVRQEVARRNTCARIQKYFHVLPFCHLCGVTGRPHPPGLQSLTANKANARPWRLLRNGSSAPDLASWSTGQLARPTTCWPSAQVRGGSWGRPGMQTRRSWRPWTRWYLVGRSLEQVVAVVRVSGYVLFKKPTNFIFDWRSSLVPRLSLHAHRAVMPWNLALIKHCLAVVTDAITSL